MKNPFKPINVNPSKSTTMSSSWLLQQAFRPSMLNQSQQELHRAAQALAWMGQSVIPAASDDSHTNMGYWIANRAFVGHALNDQGYLALHLPSFALVLLDSQKRLFHSSSGFLQQSNLRR